MSEELLSVAFDDRKTEMLTLFGCLAIGCAVLVALLAHLFGA
jgi:hypothetical protein